MVNRRMRKQRNVDKDYPSNPTAIKNRLAAELTSRNSESGPKYIWNPPLHCGDKDQCYHRDEKGFLVAQRIFRDVDVQLQVKLTFHLRLTARDYELNLN